MKIINKGNYFRFDDEISNNNIFSLIQIKQKTDKTDIFKQKLINRMLKQTAKGYNKTEFELKKTNYYDLILSHLQSDLHNYLINEHKMQYINNRFTPGVEFIEITELFNDFIENNQLSERDFAVERDAYQVNYELLINNHTRYARRVALDAVYGRNDNYLTLTEEKDLLDQIKLDDLNKYLQQDNIIHEYVFHKTQTSEYNSRILKDNQVKVDKYVEDNEFETIEIIKNIDQAKLNLMYAFTADYTREELNVFNMILGGDSFSKLFVNVREAHSICYYVNSKIVNRKVVQIETGINETNIEKAEKLIDQQLLAMKNGEIEELEVAKNKIINSYRGLENDYLLRKSLIESNILYGLTAEIPEIIELIKNVKADKIIEMANDLKKIKKVVVK